MSLPAVSDVACKMSTGRRPVWVQGHCRINPPRFLAECRKRRLNQGSFVLLYFRLSALFDLYLVFLCLFSCTVFVFSSYMCFSPVLLCLSVSVKSLAVKTTSEMTYIVSGGALNSAHSLTYSLKNSVRILLESDILCCVLKSIICVS